MEGLRPERSHVRVFVADGAESLNKQISEEIAGGHYLVTSVSLVVHPETGQLIALVAFDLPH